MRRLVWGLAASALVLSGWSCSGKGAAEKEAEREFYVVSRDLEQDLENLPEAIERYGELAKRHPATEAGQRASRRRQELVAAQPLLATADTTPADSLEALYTAVCRASSSSLVMAAGSYRARV